MSSGSTAAGTPGATLADLPPHIGALDTPPLARRGALFLLWCFEWEPRLWERLAIGVLPFGNIALRPGEVGQWFANAFDIERIAGETGLQSWPRAWAAYLMTHR